MPSTGNGLGAFSNGKVQTVFSLSYAFDSVGCRIARYCVFQALVSCLCDLLVAIHITLTPNPTRCALHMWMANDQAPGTIAAWRVSALLPG